MDAHAQSHARRARLLSVLLGAAGLVLAACTAAQPPASAAVQPPGTGTSTIRSSASPQVREGGQVTVAVSWAGPPPVRGSVWRWIRIRSTSTAST